MQTLFSNPGSGIEEIHTVIAQNPMGNFPMSDRFAAYREAGYDFLVLTDHRKVNDVSAYSTPDFLAISGSEVHPSNPYGGATYHFVAINIHETLNCAKMHPNAVLDEIKAQGGEAVLCHPLLVWTHDYRLSAVDAVTSRLRSTTTPVWGSVKAFPSRPGTIFWIEADLFLASLRMMHTAPNTTAFTDGLW